MTIQEWERVAQAEADMVENLSALCRDLVTKLRQYTDIEAEEARLKEILEEGKNEEL